MKLNQFFLLIQLTYQAAVELNMTGKHNIIHPWILVECVDTNKEVLYRTFHSQIIPLKEYNGHKIQVCGKIKPNAVII